MTEGLISWMIILVTAYLWGNAGLGSLTKINGWLASSKKKERVNWKIDEYIIAGMCMLTVYTQIFSIFYKVGAVALWLVIAIDIVFFFVIKAKLVLELKHFFQNRNRVYYIILVGIVCIIIGIIVLKLTALPANHYDSSLYHAQSIRWIEEYGIVKGLGNLHNRLAYNSAFFCFQALFSFSFILGKSLHTANGLIAVVFLCYAVCSAKVWKNKRVSVSDFVRLGLILYILSVSAYISSPNSDLLANGLVLYIICKWISYKEDKEDKLLPYTVLCFLAVWAVSVKLSASIIVFLAIYPAVKLLKNKEWKQIVLCIFIGLGIIIPFLIRNVIISGYLIYPYPELDLFNVDWKMPPYTLLYDRNEIAAWGRGLRDVFRFNEPIRVWFPVWYETLGPLKKWWWLAVASGCFILIKCIYKIVCAIWKRSAEYSDIAEALQYSLIVCTMSGCMFMWFISAPLPRYGEGYLYMISLFGIGELFVGLLNKLEYVGMEPVCFAFVLGLSANSIFKTDEIHLLRVPDYNNYICDEVMIGQYSFYVPCEGDLTGYSAFPSTPYRKRPDEIELRGDTLCDGFRVKDEYKDAFVSPLGEVYSENVFDSSGQ